MVFVDSRFVESDVELSSGSPQPPRVEQHTITGNPDLKQIVSSIIYLVLQHYNIINWGYVGQSTVRPCVPIESCRYNRAGIIVNRD